MADLQYNYGAMGSGKTTMLLQMIHEYEKYGFKIMLLKSMHAGKFKIMTKLILPSNIPTLISVLKINVGLSWVGSIMGEYLSSREGLGYLIVYGSQIFQLDLVMASTVILCVLAGGMYAAVAILEKIVRKKFAQ